jgi:hypothetical protein
MSKPNKVSKISFREATKNMTEAEIDAYRRKLSGDSFAESMSRRDERGGLIHDLHTHLFSEANDQYYDSKVEAKERKKGISPMQQEHTDKVNQKRLDLGVSPLAIDGTEQDNSAYSFCKEVVKDLSDKEIKDVIEAVSDKKIKDLIDRLSAKKGNESVIMMLREKHPNLGVVDHIRQIDVTNQAIFRLVNFLSCRHT